MDGVSSRTLAMQRLYERGLSLKAVGEVFGISDVAVLKRFQKAGIPRRRWNISEYQREQLQVAR